MKPDVPASVPDLPDEYSSWLADCDDALAAGKPPSGESRELSTGDTLAADPSDRDRDVNYLRRVRQLLRPSALREGNAAWAESSSATNLKSDSSDSNSRKVGLEDSAHPTTLPPDAPQLGDFRIIRQIARGGMGVVYEAEQLSIGRRVALKVLPFAAVLDPKQLQRFKNEVHTVGQLHHTHIVPIYSVGCERGVHYYAMQYIEGQSLAEVIRDLRRAARMDREGVIGNQVIGNQVSGTPTHAHSDRSPITDYRSPSSTSTSPLATLSTERSSNSPAFFRTVANFGVQAADALEHAHDLGVIHRDIKPGNLLVDSRGNIWITDFGLASISAPSPLRGEGRGEGCELTMTGDLVGTLRYMSPEQALAKRVLVDHRTDIYSLGVTLYEMLTLEPAVRGSDCEEVFRQIAFEEPRPPRRLNRAIPPELETIVLKAIAKNPGERFATAQELADDLQRFLEDKPIRAKRPTLRQRVTKWARRHRAVVWSGAAFLALAFIGLVASTLVIARQRDIARANYELAEQRKELAETHAKVAEQQRQLAQRNFQRARAAVDDMLTNVATERLADVPQMERVRRTLLEDALKFYKEFFEEQSTDPEVRLETARAYRAVANLRLYLGEITESEEPSDRSVELLETLAAEFPSQPQYRKELAVSLGTSASAHANTGRLHKAEQEVRKAMAINEELSTEFPDEAELRTNLAGGHTGLAWLLQDRPREAEEHCRIAIQICETIVKDSSETPNCREVLANGYYLLGTFLMNSSQSREAEQTLRQAITELEKAPQGSSTVGQRSIIAATRMYLAMTLEAEGRAQESEEAYRDAMAIYAQLAVDFPFVPGYRGAWLASFGRLGALLVKGGREEEVQAMFRQFEIAAAKLPSEAMSRMTLRDFLRAIVDRCMEAGAYESAERTYQRVIELDKELVAALPDEPAYRMGLVDDHSNRAVVRIKKGQRQEAADGFREAIAICQQLVAEYPHDLFYRFRLASIQNFLGILFRSRIDEAEKAHGQAIALCEKLITVAPDEPIYRGELMRGHYALGLARGSAGQTREAAESFRQTITIGQPLGSKLDGTGYAYLMPAAHSALFEILVAQSKFEEADDLYRKLIELNPADAEGKNHLAWLLATCSVPKYRNFPKAVELARQAVALAPRDANIWNTLGVAHYRAGNWPAAIEALMRSEDLAPGRQTADNAFFLAMAHWQIATSTDTATDLQGQHQTAARDWYDRAVAWMEQSSPRNPELKRFRAEAASILGKSQNDPQ